MLPPHLEEHDDSRVLDLLRDLQSLDASTVASHHILDRVPYIFDDDRHKYIEWKEQLAFGLDVDPSNICIVGSAATGVSLSPQKRLAIFHDNSDVDVAVISAWHFDIAWHTLREFATHGFMATTRQRRGVNSHRASLLFDGCIATNSILGLLPFKAQWMDALASTQALDPTVGRIINTRIYRDYGSLRHYQMAGVLWAKTALENGDWEDD